MKAELVNDLYKKLTRRNPGEEVFSALLSGLVLLIVIAAALELSGLLSAGLWFVAVLQVLGMMIKACGWRSVTLRNDEQDYLQKNLKIGLDKAKPGPLS